MAAAPAPGANDFPWWLVVAILIGIAAAFGIWASGLYSQIFATVVKGLGITIRVTLIGFVLASALGLVMALLGMSRILVVRQVARFYIEIIRGIPMLVLLFSVAFVVAPALVDLWNWAMAPLQRAGMMRAATVRDFSFEWRAIIALMIGYSSFIAEVFRGGIQSVETGQIEAAKALGLSGFQRFRLVVWPQALRNFLPAYGNDFVAMVKDSSLVSVVGVADITQAGKLYSASSFRYMESYAIVAYIYLILTIGLSLALRRLEKKLRDQRTTAPEH